MDKRSRLPDWAEALRQLVAKAEGLGVLVMVSSIVGGNPHRKLEVYVERKEQRHLLPGGARTGSDGVSYLLNANVFIQAKNLHYGFDFCPAFWE